MTNKSLAVSSHASHSAKKFDEKQAKVSFERSDSDSEPHDSNNNSNNNNILTRFIPNEFRSPSSSSSRSESLFRLVRCDCLVLKSCAACKQIWILLTTLVIITIMCLDECFKHKYIQRKDESESEVTKLDQEKPFLLSCGGAYYFLIIAVIAFFVESFTLLCYILHIVETFPRVPWLVIECVFYPIWAIQYFVASVLVCTKGKGWLIFAAVLGFIDSFLFLILAIIKFRKLKQGLPAQPASDDPDGNKRRAASPNVKFISQPKQRKHKKHKNFLKSETGSESMNSV